MDKIEKLFRKISQKDKIALVGLVEALLSKNKDKNLDIKKLKDTDFYRIRKGNFRIIFHYDSFKEIIIDSIRLRKENTYKDF